MSREDLVAIAADLGISTDDVVRILARQVTEAERREREAQLTKREIRIANISARRLAQGEGIDEQYERLNAARDKRWRRRKRNVRAALEHGSIITLVGQS
jgi:hypothetical protein